MTECEHRIGNNCTVCHMYLCFWLHKFIPCAKWDSYFGQSGRAASVQSSIDSLERNSIFDIISSLRTISVISLTSTELKTCIACITSISGPVEVSHVWNRDQVRFLLINTGLSIPMILTAMLSIFQYIMLELPFEAIYSHPLENESGGRLLLNHSRAVAEVTAEELAVKPAVENRQQNNYELLIAQLLVFLLMRHLMGDESEVNSQGIRMTDPRAESG